MDIDEIKEALEKDKQERVARVADGIQKLLDENHCAMRPSLTIDMDGTHFSFGIITTE
jgi:hypothetical protein